MSANPSPMGFPIYLPESAGLTRHMFFTGKGGVGKTSLSCATALRLADEGKRVLLASTDPASNLDEVLGVALGSRPTPVPGVPGLHAMNIDPVAAAAAYRERTLAPLRGLLPAPVLQRMEEELSGACTVEIAAFDEFTGLLADSSLADAYDHLIFDTAPTGHTLRLMGLAKAWDHFLDDNTSGTSCLGPLAGLEKQRAAYAETVACLADATRTTLVLVSRPQLSALREAQRTADELRAIGVANQRLVLNGCYTATDREDGMALAMEARGAAAITEMSGFLSTLPVQQVPLRGRAPLGLDGLRALLAQDLTETSECHKTVPLDFDRSKTVPVLAGPDETEFPEARPGRSCYGPEATASAVPALPDRFIPINRLLEELAKPGRGVILTMGKGGVGKTTVAAAIAMDLAARGHRVHLTTTDPAAHLADAVGEDYHGFTLGRIDPETETEAYRAGVLEAAGAGLDAAGRALLEEDLRSPCTEEIAVFRAFAREVARGEDGFVVLDTAPTGHTLLLLDASAAYHRELARQSRDDRQEDAMRLLERLRDPGFSRLLVVTLPEATPVHEAAALQDDLRRAGIEPFAWVVNQSLSILEPRDPILRERAASERAYLLEVTSRHATRAICLPWQAREPAGAAALSALLGATMAPPSHSLHSFSQVPE